MAYYEIAEHAAKVGYLITGIAEHTNWSALHGVASMHDGVFVIYAVVSLLAQAATMLKGGSKAKPD